MILKIHAAEPIACAVHFQVIEESIASPDEMAVRCGLLPLGECWRGIDRETAVAALRFILAHDMAYSLPRLPVDTVEEVIDDFVGRFSPEARFYTNGSWDKGYTRLPNATSAFGPGWQPATEATFDGGVVVLDAGKAGLLWIEDED